MSQNLNARFLNKKRTTLIILSDIAKPRNINKYFKSLKPQCQQCNRNHTLMVALEGGTHIR